MALLVCLAGGIGSGKSSLRMALAKRLGWRSAGFGDYLRNELERSGGDPSSRESLQELGRSLVDSDSVRFCRDVLASGGFVPGDDFLLDGIRHASIYRVVRELAKPSVTRLLFLIVPESGRRQRIAQRSDASDFSRAELHPVELEARVSLPELADARVDGTAPFDLVVEESLALIGRWRSPRA